MNQELLFAGAGGAFFLASPGQLNVTVYKRDRNISGAVTELRALLLSPDRRVLDEVRIPDSGMKAGTGPGPLQQAKLGTIVECTGVFALNVTASRDRYGEEIFWGFDTNCPHFLVETARGHKDEPHTEPIILSGPAEPCEVCFLPGPRSHEFDVTMLDDTRGRAELFDAAGKPVLPSTASAQRAVIPWRLCIPSCNAEIRIPGLTEWSVDDPYPDLCLWTPRFSSFFSLHEHRWLLLPYNRTLYRLPGEVAETTFKIHNNGDTSKDIALDIEYSSGPAWRIQLSASSINVPPREDAEVRARCLVTRDMPANGAPFTAFIRATPVTVPATLPTHRLQ